MAKKQQNSALPLIAGAVGFGVVAALMAMLYLNAREAQLKAEYEQQQADSTVVVVANQDLPKGSIIQGTLFKPELVPNKYVHGDVVLPNDFGSYEGQALTANLRIGQTLLKSFVDADFPRDFSDVVSAGKRAMTITVDDINSIGGFLRPGNRVDVFVNIPFAASGFSPSLIALAKDEGLLNLLPPEVLSEIPSDLLDAADALDDPTELLGMAAPTDVIIPVIQNVKVLAAGRDPYRETLDELGQPQRRTETTFSNIALEVDPQQAALITLAIDKGEIVTLLRNRNDEGASAFTTVGPPDLFGNAAQMAAAEKERASRVTEAGGVDANGNLVDADGNVLMTAKQLADSGYTVNENGQLVAANKPKPVKVAQASGVDARGNLVDSSGRTLASAAQLAAAGYSVNENGEIVDKDGNIVNPADIVVAPDGTVMTKQQLAAAGLTVNANGEIVDQSGNVVSAADIEIAADGSVTVKESGVIDPSDIIVTADGTVMSKQQLAAAGLSVNESGQIIDKDGNVVSAADVVIAADGTIMTKEQLAAAGLSVNANGEIVDANGKVVSPDDLVITADGKVMSKAELAAAGLSVNENGEIVDRNGKVVSDDVIVAPNGAVMSKEQLAAAGLSVDENGNIVDKHGNIVDPDDLVTGPDGTILSKKALAERGLKVNENGEIVDAEGNVLSDAEIAAVAKEMVITGTVDAGKYTLIIGGASEDGVAKSSTVTVRGDEEEAPAEGK